MAEIDFNCLIPLALRLSRYEDPGRYPSVKRDLALILPEDVLDSQVRDAILSGGGSLIESVEVFDIYVGEQIPEGTKSLAYGIVFRSPSRTLTEDEIDGLQKKIEDHLAGELGAKIRMK